jgi:hypothetical protein
MCVFCLCLLVVCYYFFNLFFFLFSFGLVYSLVSRISLNPSTLLVDFDFHHVSVICFVLGCLSEEWFVFVKVGYITDQYAVVAIKFHPEIFIK